MSALQREANYIIPSFMIHNIVVHGCRHPHWRDYVDQIQRTPETQISHVWDRSEEHLSAALQETGARKFDPATPIEGTSAILLLSETVHHLHDIRALLNWKVPMFVEKPLGIQRADATDIYEIIAQSNLPFHTGFFLRTVPALVQARKLIENGRLGSVAHLKIRFAHDGVRSGWLRDNWLTDPKSAGVDGFGDLAIHCLDLLRWWRFKTLAVGPYISANIMRRTVADDFGVAFFTYPGGAAVIEAGWATGAGPMLEIEVLGSRGALRTIGNHLFLQSDNNSEDLGEIALAAGEGLRPFLTGTIHRDWSECVSIQDALAANLMIAGFHETPRT